MANMTARAKSVRAERIRQCVLRSVAIGGSVPPMLVALFVSYGHIHDVTLKAGESPQTAAIMALSIDGLILVSSVAIISGRRSLVPYLAFGMGVTASLAANLVSAEREIVSMVVATWPAIALVLTSELLLRLLLPPTRKRTRKRSQTRTAKPQTTLA